MPQKALTTCCIVEPLSITDTLWTAENVLISEVSSFQEYNDARQCPECPDCPNFTSILIEGFHCGLKLE